MECTISNKKIVTLSSAVKASIIDKWEDIGKTEQRYSHWACRELKLLYNQILPKIPYKETLVVNQNTFTATLPLGFYEETFVGGINERWQKVPFKLNNRLVDSKNIKEVPCEDACPKCQQDTNICNDLVVTEVTNTIVLANNPYTQTVIKKLYPNGDYYLETESPILDIETDEVSYVTKKEFITNFDLRPCGCLDITPANIATLQNVCPDIYCNYYAPCEQFCSNNNWGYRIFEETGLIQFDRNFPFNKVYIEYHGFIQKIRGQYYLPEVAFECVVEGIKKRAIKDKPNVANWQIFNQKEDYKIAKRDLQKVLGRVSLAQIIQAINSLPKFDFDNSNDWYSHFCYGSTSIGSSTDTTTSSSSSSTTNNTYVTGMYVLSVKATGTTGMPVPGASTYQNNLLKGSSGLGWIFLAKQTFTELDGDYTLNTVTGTLDISPNIFIENDSLLIPYNKTSS